MGDLVSIVVLISKEVPFEILASAADVKGAEWLTSHSNRASK